MGERLWKKPQLVLIAIIAILLNSIPIATVFAAPTNDSVDQEIIDKLNERNIDFEIGGDGDSSQSEQKKDFNKSEDDEHSIQSLRDVIDYDTSLKSLSSQSEPNKTSGLSLFSRALSGAPMSIASNPSLYMTSFAATATNTTVDQPHVTVESDPDQVLTYASWLPDLQNKLNVKLNVVNPTDTELELRATSINSAAVEDTFILDTYGKGVHEFSKEYAMELLEGVNEKQVTFPGLYDVDLLRAGKKLGHRGSLRTEFYLYDPETRTRYDAQLAMIQAHYAIDVEGPKITINGVYNGAYLQKAVHYNITYEDPTPLANGVASSGLDIDSIEVKLNGKKVPSKGTIELPDGIVEYTLTVTALDHAKNKSEKTIVFALSNRDEDGQEPNPNPDPGNPDPGPNPGPGGDHDELEEPSDTRKYRISYIDRATNDPIRNPIYIESKDKRYDYVKRLSGYEFFQGTNSNDGTIYYYNKFIDHVDNGRELADNEYWFRYIDIDGNTIKEPVLRRVAAGSTIQELVKRMEVFYEGGYALSKKAAFDAGYIFTYIEDDSVLPTPEPEDPDPDPNNPDPNNPDPNNPDPNNPDPNNPDPNNPDPNNPNPNNPDPNNPDPNNPDPNNPDPNNPDPNNPDPNNPGESKKIEVKFLDETGKEIGKALNVEIPKDVDAIEYIMSLKDDLYFEGYEFFELDDASLESDGIVKLVYTEEVPKEEQGTVIVRYIDEGERDLLPAEVQTGKIGEPYTTEEKAIAGYELKEQPANAKGTYQEEDQEVKYVYTPSDKKENENGETPIPEKESSTGGNDDSNKPNEDTGSSSDGSSKEKDEQNNENKDEVKEADEEANKADILPKTGEEYLTLVYTIGWIFVCLAGAVFAYDRFKKRKVA